MDKNEAFRSKVKALLAKTDNIDKDERFMATSDLMHELEGFEGGRLDATLQTQIRDAIIKELDDKSADVQTIAVSCLSVVVKKFEEPKVLEIVDKITKNLLEGQEDLRDIYATGVKTIIGAAPKEFGASLSVRLCDTLVGYLRAITPASAGANGAAPSPSSSSSSASASSSAMSSELTVRMQLVCLDIFRDLLVRFGSTSSSSTSSGSLAAASASSSSATASATASSSAITMQAREHEGILTASLPLLDVAKVDVRKRAANTLGALVSVINDKLFKALMDALMAKITSLANSSNSGNNEVLYTYIQTIGVISRNAGVRIGRYLSQVVPVLEQFSAIPSASSSSTIGGKVGSETFQELRENCLQAFESLLLRCPTEICAHVPRLMQLAQWYLTYDPNYTNQDDAGMEDGGWGAASASASSSSSNKMKSDWDEEPEEDEAANDAAWDDDVADYGDDIDDDDTSWKVRRAAVKVFSACIRTQSEQLPQFYDQFLDLLVSRFRERTASVQTEVLACFGDLLLASVTFVSSSSSSASAASSSAATAASSSSSSSMLMPAEIATLRPFAASLAQPARVDRVLKALLSEFDSGQLSTKVAILQALRELERVLPANARVAAHMTELLKRTIVAVKDKDNGLRAAALSYLRLLLQQHSTATISTQVNLLAPAMVPIASDPYTRIKLEGIYCCGLLAYSFRNKPKMHSINQANLEKLFNAVHAQLLLNDVEHEVKEAAMASIAVIIAYFGHFIPELYPASLSILLERLKNEVTRQGALKALSMIAASPRQPPLLKMDAILQPTLAELCTLMRKHSAMLRHDSAATLVALVGHHGEKIDSAQYVQILKETAPYIRDEDLHLAHLVLELCARCACQADQDVMPVLQSEVLPRVLAFLRSPLLLQGGLVVQSLGALFRTLLLIKCDLFGFDKLMTDLLQTVAADSSKQSLYAVAECVASVALASPHLVASDEVIDHAAASAANLKQTVAVFLQQVLDERVPSHGKCIALLSLGFIGRDIDLCAFHQPQQLQQQQSKKQQQQQQPHESSSQLEQVLFNALALPSDDVKAAAAFALGNVSCGSQSRLVPLLLQSINQPSNHSQQYLLLASLKEFLCRQAACFHVAVETALQQHAAAANGNGGGVEMEDASSSTSSSSQPSKTPSKASSSASASSAPLTVEEYIASATTPLLDALQPHVNKILPILYQHTSNEDEGVRAMVSECLGKLASFLPDPLLSELAQQCASPSAHTRATMVAAVKFAMSKYVPIESFQKQLPAFLILLRDQDINVRRQAFLTLTAVINHNFELVASQLNDILPAVYAETVTHPELVREIDLGPFTRRIDDGFPLRKAAFQVLDTLLDVAASKLSLVEFVRNLHEGICDEEKDIQLLAYQILYKVTVARGVHVLEVVDDLPPFLTKGITKKIKESKENDPERALDVLRSAVRALYALHCVPGSELCEKFSGFYARVLQTALLKEMLAQMLQQQQQH